MAVHVMPGGQWAGGSVQNVYECVVCQCVVMLAARRRALQLVTAARRPSYNEQRRHTATFSISRNHTEQAAGWLLAVLDRLTVHWPAQTDHQPNNIKHRTCTIQQCYGIERQRPLCVSDIFKLLCLRPHRAEALSDAFVWRLTSVRRLSVCRVHRA